LQVLLSTAQWLASSQGFDRHGSSLTVEDLQQPKICVYFAAAYLSVLSNYGGSARTEGFVARAYHAGPKGVDTAAARIFLQKYLKAKHWLTEVAKAMAVTVAAAALAAGVALPPAAAAAVTGAAAAAGAAAVAGGTEVPLGAAHAKVLALADTAAAGAAPDKTDQACKDQNISSSAGSTAADASGPDSSSIPGVSTGDHDSSTNSSSCGSRQVLVRRGTADLLTALCSSWEDVQQATGKGMPAAPDSSSAAGSILAHMLPSRWGLSSSRQQQQQHGQHIRPGSSSGSNSGGAAGEGPLALVSVDAADLCTAWLRLLCTSPVVARVALGQAAAAMALAPFPSEDWQIASAPAAAAAESDAAAAGSALGSSGSDGGRSAASRLGLIGGHSSSGRARSSGTAAAAGPAAAAAAAAGAQVEAMPCVMHVVGHGETLQRIAAVCNLGVPDLLAANPEVTAADTVHHNDCIAVPLPAVFPRLYVIQPGDTLHSIARAHEVPLGRVLAKNPELTDPSRVQPGWVVALPGLKGDSQVALPADWLLTQVSPPSAQGPYQQQQQQAAWGLQVQAYPGVVADAEAQLHTSADRGLHQQQGMAAAGQQQGLIAATSQQRQGSRHHRSRLKPGSSSGRSQQQQQCVPPVGSGAFLFTVGAGTAGAGSSSSSAGTAVSTSSRAVGVSQRIGKRSGSRKHTNRDSSTATPAGRTMDLAAAQLGDGRD
jgi:LysM repeat protein